MGPIFKPESFSIGVGGMSRSESPTMLRYDGRVQKPSSLVKVEERLLAKQTRHEQVLAHSGLR